MHDHKPPLWGYDALAISLASALVVACCLLVAEVYSLLCHALVPGLQRLIRLSGREPPAFLDDALELADVLGLIVEQALYQIFDRLDAPLFALLRWLWGVLHVSWFVELVFLLADILLLLPAEVWRLLTEEAEHDEKSSQDRDHLPDGRSLDNRGGTGDGRQPR